MSHPASVRSFPLVAVAAALALCSGAAVAQYKVIGADGKVTYTDREPASSEGRVVPLGGRAPVQQAEPELPFDLRQVASRYPVTLYTTSNACEPCNVARAQLRQRGIPFAERQVVTEEDSAALEKISGAREAPTLTIGSQTLRGYSAESWTSYLDAAGYPKDSRLPAGYAWRQPAPIVDRRDAAAGRAAVPAQPTGTTSAAQPSGTAGIRF